MSAIPEMDDIDRRILEVLQQQSDIPNNALADLVGLTPGPCLRRVQRLRKSGIIRSYTIEVNPEALGYQISALVEISLRHHTRQAAARFMKAVRSRELIVSCHMIAGDCDFILLVRARDVVEFRTLIWQDLHTIEGVEKIRSNIILDTVK